MYVRVRRKIKDKELAHKKTRAWLSLEKFISFRIQFKPDHFGRSQGRSHWPVAPPQPEAAANSYRRMDSRENRLKAEDVSEACVKILVFLNMLKKEAFILMLQVTQPNSNTKILQKKRKTYSQKLQLHLPCIGWFVVFIYILTRLDWTAMLFLPASLLEA